MADELETPLWWWLWSQLGGTLVLWSNVCWAGVLLYFMLNGPGLHEPAVVSSKPDPLEATEVPSEASPQQPPPEPVSKRKLREPKPVEDESPAATELRDLKKRYEKCKHEANRLYRALEKFEEEALEVDEKHQADLSRLRKKQEVQEKELTELKDRCARRKGRSETVKKRIAAQEEDAQLARSIAAEAEELRLAEAARTRESESSRREAKKEKEQASQEYAQTKEEQKQLRDEDRKRREDLRYVSKENGELRQDIRQIRAKIEAALTYAEEQRRESARRREEEREERLQPPRRGDERVGQKVEVSDLFDRAREWNRAQADEGGRADEEPEWAVPGQMGQMAARWDIDDGMEVA